MVECEPELAREVLGELFVQRTDLLAVLPPAEVGEFLALARLHLEAGDPTWAVALCRRLRPFLTRQEHLRRLADIELAAQYSLWRVAEMLPLAESWVAERHPGGPSALGFHVLAEHALVSRRPGDAMDWALSVVAMASSGPVESLDHCYAVAVAAALELRDKDHALLLWREMQSRGMEWPRCPRLRPWRGRIEKLLQKEGS